MCQNSLENPGCSLLRKFVLLVHLSPTFPRPLILAISLVRRTCMTLRFFWHNLRIILSRDALLTRLVPFTIPPKTVHQNCRGNLHYPSTVHPCPSVTSQKSNSQSTCLWETNCKNYFSPQTNISGWFFWGDWPVVQKEFTVYSVQNESKLLYGTPQLLLQLPTTLTLYCMTILYVWLFKIYV